MKIAYFIDGFPKLSETFILNQIDDLLSRGHEVVIFPVCNSGETKCHSVVEKRRLFEKTHFPPKVTGGLSLKARFYLRIVPLKLAHWKQMTRLRSKLKGYQYTANWMHASLVAEPVLRHGGKFDVLLAHFGPNGLRASWYRDAGLIEGPLVTIFHAYDLTVFMRGRKENIYDPLLRSGELFLPISGFWRDKLQILGFPPEKINVHHVGIDYDHFSFRAHTREADEPIIIISVARLVDKKGIEFAIHALNRLVASGLKVRYRIVGTGPLLDSLKQLVSEKGLEQHVTFLGAKTSDEVVVELSKAHLFLAPSVTSKTGDMEGIPTVLMEAMAVGLPVISTLHSGIPELVEDGVSGKLVSERDVDGLADAIHELAANVEHWPVIGANGRKKVRQEFNIKKLNEQLEDLFEQL